VASVLEDHGYQPVSAGGHRYTLDFEIEEGPINVDSTITLSKDGQVLARGWGRDGGPRKIFQHGEVVRRAFAQSLDDFSAQLARVSRFDMEETLPPLHPAAPPSSYR
jgi:hypothetical protein